MQIGVRQQGEEAGALDRGRQLPLIVGFGAGDAGGHDFAGFGDEVFQDVDVLVINFGDAFRSEAALFATLEQATATVVVFFLELGCCATMS